MRHRGVVVLCVLLFPGASTATPILTNGSFEVGPAMNGPACSISPASCEDVDVLAGSTVIPGWTVFGASLDYLGPPWSVSDGLHALDLDGRDATFSGVQQTFATSIGQVYQVAFDLSGNPGGAPIKQVRVSVASVTHDYAFDVSGLTMTTLAWQPISFVFTAWDPTATLSFMSLSSTASSHGPALDHVRVVAVPEPSTVALLGAGLVLMIPPWRRRTARSAHVVVLGHDGGTPS